MAVADPHTHESAALRRRWSQRAKEQLAANGYRAGGARMAVVDLLASEGGCLEAEEIVTRLRARGRKVGTASVYRALALLVDLGLVHKLALPQAPVRFELVMPGGEHHHHLVCVSCDVTVPFSDAGLEVAVAEISRHAAFEVQAHDVTLHGLCEDCQSG